MCLHVTFRQLQVFESVARHRSYTRAAEELHLTQPAVSMQVKQLEHVLGLALFEHLGRRVYLTDAGEIVLHHSRRIATELNDAGQALEDLKGIDGGRLRLVDPARLMDAAGTEAKPGVRCMAGTAPGEHPVKADGRPRPHGRSSLMARAQCVMGTMGTDTRPRRPRRGRSGPR